MSRSPKISSLSPEQIAALSSRLAPKYAEILALSAGLSYEGMAADLNISIGTVKSRLFRARAQIVRFIEEDANVGS